MISTEVQLRFCCGTFTAALGSILQFCVVLVLQGPPGVRGVCGFQGLPVSSGWFFRSSGFLSLLRVRKQVLAC